MDGLWNDYQYQQAIRRRRNTPPEVSATPSLREITSAYAAQHAKMDTDAVAASNAARLRDLRLAEQSRQFNAEMGLQGETLGDARRAGMIASGIGLANLLGTAGQAMLQSRMADQSARLQNETLAMQKRSLEEQQAQHQEILKTYRQMSAFLKASVGGESY